MKKVFKIASIVFAGVIVLGAIASCGKSDSTNSNTNSTTSKTEQKVKEVKYTEVNANDVIALVHKNGLKASKEYKDKDLKIINCKVSKIDSDGDGIQFSAPGETFTLAGIYASIDSDDKQLQNKVAELENGKTTTIYIHVNDVGDTLGLRGELKNIELNK